MNLSPVILFTYNRLWHTQQTIHSLKQNELAKKSELFIYSDAPKDEASKQKVLEVRKYLKSIDGFKKVTLIEREKNWGLGNSIIDGVTKVMNDFGKVIVLEDDMVTSPYFLNFMNDALNYFEEKKKVWHICGWNYPIDEKGLDDVFLWRTMNCWGWGTWADRWNHFEKNTDKLINTFSKKEIKRFNLNGFENFWKQVIDNKKGRIDTWAIYWYATIFQNNGLCLNPTKTYLKNIGHDGSGTHCHVTNQYDSDLNQQKSINFNVPLYENQIALNRIQQFYKHQKKHLPLRVYNKLVSLMK